MGSEGTTVSFYMPREDDTGQTVLDNLGVPEADAHHETTHIWPTEQVWERDYFSMSSSS